MRPEAGRRRKASLPVILLLCAALAALPACRGDSGQKSAQKADAEQNTDAAGGGAPTPAQKAGPAELARANAILDFHNRAVEILHRGAFARASDIAGAREIYLDSYRLPRLKKAGSRAAARSALVPPAGLFSPDEEAVLARELAGMDAALQEMQAGYADLERYVRDDGIVDDGREGRRLCKELGARHDVFMAARRSWLGIVTKRAREAEKILLEEHPLRRQILAGQEIFALIGQAAGLLSAQKPDKAAIARTGQEMAAAVAEAGEPPFPASPAVERQFRNFLRQASGYLDQIKEGLAQGFYAPGLRRLNVQSARVRRAYNAFVRAANEPKR